jgi:hypothetical protein
MEAPLKELDKLNKLVSDEPSMGKSKTPAIQDSLNSLLQTLHMSPDALLTELGPLTLISVCTTRTWWSLSPQSGASI